MQARGFRQRHSAWLVVLWLLAAALLAPVAEVGDLLEAVLTVPVRPRIVLAAGEVGLAAHAPGRCPGAPEDAAGPVLARYVGATSSSSEPSVALTALFAVAEDRPEDAPAQAPLWRDLERGPPARA